MNTLADEPRVIAGEKVKVTADTLLHGTAKERNHWRFIGRGEGIHWPDLDEDISIEGLVPGKPAGESQSSFARWLEKRGEQKAK